MRVADISPALARLGADTRAVIPCAAKVCQKQFTAHDGFAFSLSVRGRDPCLYFFCSAACVVDALEPQGSA